MEAAPLDGGMLHGRHDRMPHLSGDLDKRKTIVDVDGAGLRLSNQVRRTDVIFSVEIRPEELLTVLYLVLEMTRFHS